MKLNPGERSILGAFFQRTDAEAALEELRQAGFTEVQLDRISEHGFEGGADSRRPAIGGGASSLSATVLHGHEGAWRDDVAQLLAAMPAVSGMAGEVEQTAPFLLTIVTGEERVEEALQIVRRHRGKA
ncbi:MAG: hypothetical protein ACOY93_16340 [Bacillota bacterium]